MTKLHLIFKTRHRKIWADATNRGKMHIVEYGIYLAGFDEPHYPVPAIPLRVVIGESCLWVDNVSNEEDPIMVYACQSDGTWTMKDGSLDKFTHN